jgi:RimJ/RimL family protein N-acetyltransferase
MIETQRLHLSPIRVADAAEMSRVLADPAMYAFSGDAPETAERLAVRYARWVAGATKPGQTWVNLVVRERATGAAVGYVQATVNPGAADLAWVIGTAWQRKGYATEATLGMVEWLERVHRVQTFRALIRADHAASHGVATRLGLVRTIDEVDGEQVWRRVLKAG